MLTPDPFARQHMGGAHRGNPVPNSPRLGLKGRTPEGNPGTQKRLWRFKNSFRGIQDSEQVNLRGAALVPVLVRRAKREGQGEEGGGGV